MINDIEIEGDFSENDLSRHNFTYTDSRLSNIDLWLRRNRITGRLFEYNRSFDRLSNHARRMYTGYVYHRKKKKILGGDWREYEASNK